MFQLRIQAPPFLVLKVDVELGEGGQLAVVAFPNLDRARGECASNKCLAIWSKDDLIHIQGVFFHWASPKMLEYPNWASQKS